MLTLLKAAEILELLTTNCRNADSKITIHEITIAGPELADLIEALHFGADALLFLDHHRKRSLPFAVHLLPIEIQPRL